MPSISTLSQIIEHPLSGIDCVNNYTVSPTSSPIPTINQSLPPNSMLNPIIRRSKRSKHQYANVYNGKGGGYACRSSDSFIHILEWNDIQQNLTSSDHPSL